MPAKYHGSEAEDYYGDQIYLDYLLNQRGLGSVFYNGYRKDFQSLTTLQKIKFLEMVDANLNDEVQRKLMKTGLYVLSEMERAREEKGLEVYPVILRGSVARGEARGEAGREDDIDFLVIGKDGKKLIKYAKPMCLEIGKQLKEELNMKRPAEGVINFHTPYTDHEWEQFVSCPTFIDMFDIDPLSKYKEQMVQCFLDSATKVIERSGILDRTEEDPFEFYRKVLEIGKRGYGLDLETCNHNLLITSARLHGIPSDDVDFPRHRITELRDRFLSQELRESA